MTSRLDFRIDLHTGVSVSALLLRPPSARSCLVLGHGAGAGMHHTFMAALAEGLAARDVATLRYQFPYMEGGGARPDPPALAQATVRAAVAEAARVAPGLALFAGGKSFGGRMTSQAQAAAPLPGVRGLVFVGFPLHPAGKPGDSRARHLAEVAIPMLFLQGTRDALADATSMRRVIEQLEPRAHGRWFEQADHSFRVPSRSGRSDADVLVELLDVATQWIDGLAAPAAAADSAERAAGSGDAAPAAGSGDAAPATTR